MKPLFKYILLLIFMEILILIAGYFVVSNIKIGFLFSEIALLSIVFTLISLLTIVIFFRGQAKESGSQTLHTLVSVSLKLLIELVFAFVWFFIGKKTGLSSVLLFFVLYLAFSLFSVLTILKTLNYKSL